MALKDLHLKPNALYIVTIIAVALRGFSWLVLHTLGGKVDATNIILTLIGVWSPFVLGATLLAKEIGLSGGEPESVQNNRINAETQKEIIRIMQGKED